MRPSGIADRWRWYPVMGRWHGSAGRGWTADRSLRRSSITFGADTGRSRRRESSGRSSTTSRARMCCRRCLPRRRQSDLTDLMPVCGEDHKQRAVIADHQILRELQCTDGEMAFQMDFRPRPDYARRHVTVEDKGRLGLRVRLGRGVGWLRSNAPLQAEPDGATAQIRLRRGESCNSR